jgi:hypothetical protein
MIKPSDIVFTRLTGEPVAKGRNGLWADMTAESNANRTVEHVCMLVRNTHPAEKLYRARLWLEDVAADVAVALGSRDADPTSLTFGVPRSHAGSLALGDLDPGQAVSVWMRRRGQNVAPRSESYGWVVQGETFEVEN